MGFADRFFTRFLFGLRFFFFLFQAHLGNQLTVSQSLGNRVKNGPIHQITVFKAQLHLGGMNVHIDKVLINVKMQQGERVLMLHQIGLVGVLYGFGNNIALNIPPVNKIIFIVPVSPADQRLARKSADSNLPFLALNLQQVASHLAAIDGVDQIL